MPPAAASPESLFESRVPYARRKLRGQFFTPPAIARTMTRWVCATRPDSFLDPAVGPGIFLECLADLPAAPRRIVGCDIAPLALDLARRRIPGLRPQLLRCDFLTADFPERFDAIVANPPYIRHHDADLPESLFRRFDRLHGLRFSRLTNVYCLFLLKIAALLSLRGRAAVITPTEFLNADFGRAVKRVLLDTPAFAGLIIFDAAASIFDGLLTTATITLLDAARGGDGLTIIHAPDARAADAAFDAFDNSQMEHSRPRLCKIPKNSRKPGGRANRSAVDAAHPVRTADLTLTVARLARSVLNPDKKWGAGLFPPPDPNRARQQAAIRVARSSRPSPAPSDPMRARQRAGRGEEQPRIGTPGASPGTLRTSHPLQRSRLRFGSVSRPPRPPLASDSHAETQRLSALLTTFSKAPPRPLGDFARCMRGIATGANNFFTLSEAEARRWGLPDNILVPCVTKSAHVRDTLFTADDFLVLRRAGRKCLLLDLTPETAPLAADYLAHGRRLGIHRRYLPSHRPVWYAREQRPPAPIWVGVFVRGRLRFVINRAGVLNLTTFHGIYPRAGYAERFERLLPWFAGDEFHRRCAAEQRTYGDGLLKFEPKDIERLAIPDLDDPAVRRALHP